MRTTASGFVMMTPAMTGREVMPLLFQLVYWTHVCLKYFSALVTYKYPDFTKIQLSIFVYLNI